ncbi:MAG: hypothetical protein ACOX9R_17975 [Armatimonadota bacterium]
MDLRSHGPDLEPLGSLTGQTVDAGTNWSDVETLTGVEFDANGDPIGPLACVVLATETAEDGALNRDGQPKPAVPKGTNPVHNGLGTTSPRGAVMISTLHDPENPPPGAPPRYPLDEQSADGRVTVTVRFDRELAGRTVHLAVFDPPDMSPYVSDPEDWDDIWTDPQRWGQDTAGGPGQVSPVEATAVLVEVGEDRYAEVTTELTITDQMAGDSYVVVGCIETAPTLADAMEVFDGGNGHLLVAWARKYYTIGEMCKAGSELNADALPEDTEITVADPDAFSVGDTVVIFGYHSEETRAGEELTVSAVGQESITVEQPLEWGYYRMVFPFGTPKSYVARVADGVWQLPAAWTDGLDAAYGDLSHWNGVEVTVEGEQYNGGCFTDWVPVGDTLRLPKLANPGLLDDFGRATEYRQVWAWHPPAGEDDHVYIGVCQRAELAHHRPQGMTPVDQHMSFVFVENCLAPGVDPGRTAAHELGHFMGVRAEVSDDDHPAVLSHPFDHEQYGPTFPEAHGCLMDYKADLSSTYCEFCVECIDTVRGAGVR